GGQMVFILPEDGVSVRELIGSAEAFGSLFAGEDTGFAEVKWQVPKFDFECNYDKLPETLISLGVTDAFRPDADFSGITDSAAYISEIIQQTRISIDEKGVEAAAFTQLNFLGAGYPEDEFEMILDRPFIYGIKAQNGTLLFVGICENPSR
ncbi:MAG: serpin family protein, partial [Clostridiales bacterium]|nr:serpin family protein [Clostridiales bacterium]